MIFFAAHAKTQKNYLTFKYITPHFTDNNCESGVIFVEDKNRKNQNSSNRKDNNDTNKESNKKSDSNCD